jgi:hypothetical protein
MPSRIGRPPNALVTAGYCSPCQKNVCACVCVCVCVCVFVSVQRGRAGTGTPTTHSSLGVHWAAADS